MRLLNNRMLRIAAGAGLHALWWAAASASVIVAVFSHFLGVGVYDVPCGGADCRSFLQLTETQFGHLRTIGVTPEAYGGFIVSLLTIQNLSALAIGFLVYRYGWRDPYSIVASLLILVAGTIFSTDDTLLSPFQYRLFRILDDFGSMYLFFYFLFPDGRFAPKWTIVPAVAWLIPMGAHLWFAPGTPFDHMTWPPELRGGYMLFMHGLVIVAQLCRYRQSASPERKRIVRWFIVGMSAYLLGGAIGLMAPFADNGIYRMATITLFYGGLLILPFSMGMAVLEYRLRGMAIAFNRTIVYAVLSLMIVLVYVAVVGLFGLLLHGQVNAVLALLATGFIALLGQPVRLRVQQAINHLVFGVREDPYTLLSGLVQRLEGALTHKSLLMFVTEKVALALRLPYAAIEVRRDGGTEIVAVYGSAPERSTRIPLTVQGEEVGWLALGIERAADLVPPGKRSLLDDLVRQVSIAVQAERLTEELHRSRERLVGAREEERRRLRRDLHDGLGSSLASMMLRLDQVALLQDADTDKANSLLREIQAQLREAIAEIRRLVYALRPPSLDEFGLLFALRELTLQFENSGLRISLEGPERLPRLNAAIEVALYRIAQEALTNVARHAQASSCRILLETEETTLRLEVRDDGSGMPVSVRPGIGMRSMKERAEEVGGTCRFRSEPGAGTTVTAILPLELGGWTNELERWGKAADHAG